MKCFVVFLMTLVVVNSFPLKNDEDSSLKRKILRPTAHRRVLIAPHLNDPARPNTWGVNVDWPNGGVNVGGGHNNGNHGWGVNVGWPNGGVNVGGGHNNGNHGWGVNVGWPSGGVNVGGGRNNGNSGWGFNFGSQGKRDIVPAMYDFGEGKGQGSNDMEKYE